MTREHCPFKFNRQHLGVTFIPPKPIILCEQCVGTAIEPAVTELPKRWRSRGRRGAISAELQALCVQWFIVKIDGLWHRHNNCL